ncbi:hypothetical protein [Endozoicomonas sp. 8E]|uniref:hypothetical protein n=1 Tax=Endozoicomonas sp. 8E TaxID=3035692 RepID=UPI002938FD2A|nr:hypothetical protein [Endozoicomonas sp. 8E]WOG29591.1 hypothetical protein P6910_08045 [Endozoicomonas sp. 8E]
MTTARPDALSLAVAIAISSSMIGTQALADRRLQTKSADIPGNGHLEFIQSEVMVWPTLGDDQQPIPKSFTTTYPDQDQAGADYDVPSTGFTDVLSGIEGGVSSVDQFETGENGVAQKYTKVLKVANEEIFRFTHCLKDNLLLIEVRIGMIDPDSVATVRAQLAGHLHLEPLTKIASPEHLAGVLKGANERAGNLGASHDFVTLAAIEVEQVKVNGRTFMRLIAAGDQSPELQQLGQSLFVNDEVLFAAATTAYAQVHVLGEELRYEALNDLLSYHKPVGYVVHVEDDTKAYPVPAGYPKLEVEQASEEIIVFRGQKQNPIDIAFVESHYQLWDVYSVKALTAEVKKARIKNYQYVIRSRQMALLEELAAELAAQQDAGLDLDKLSKLTYYESLQQALISATPDGTDEFEFATGHIREASSVITPTWVQFQLIKNFSFKPVLKNLLTNHNFVQNIQNLMPYVTDMINAVAVGKGTKFSRKVTGDIARQMLEMVSTLEKFRARETELTAKQVTDSSADATKARHAHMAAVLGVDDWDDTLSPEEQARLLRKKIDEMNQSVAATFIGTELALEQAVKKTLAAIEGQLGIVSDNENDLGGRTEFILQHLQQHPDQTGELFGDKLTIIEGQLGLAPTRKDDPAVRQKTIRMHLLLRLAKVGQQPHFQHQYQQKLEAKRSFLQKLQHMVNLLPTIDKNLRDTAAKARVDINTQLAAELGTDHWDDTRPLEEQERIIREKILDIKRSPDEKDAETGQPWQEAVKARLAPIKSRLGITLNNEDDLDTFYQSIQQQLQQRAKPNNVVIQNSLTDFERKLGLASDNGKNPEVRRQVIQQNLRQHLAWVTQQLRQQQDSRTDAEIKARYTTLAAHLNIQDFDSNTNIDAQQEQLLKKLTTMKARDERQRQQIKTMYAQYELLLQKIQTTSEQPDPEDFYNRAKKGVLAAMPGVELSDDITPEGLKALELAVHSRLLRLSDLEQEMGQTPGHPGVRPEVLATLTVLEKALKMDDLNGEDDVYKRRNAISKEMELYMPKVGQKAEKEALEILEKVEEIFKIEVNKDDHKAARLERIFTKLNTGDFSESMVDELEDTLWQEDFPPVREKWETKLEKLKGRLSFYIEIPDLNERIIREDRKMLEAIEEELNIDISENPAKRRRDMDFIAELASDLKVEFEEGASLNDQKDALRDKILALREELNNLFDNEELTRETHNEIARLLCIEDYKDDASEDEQASVIEDTLRELDAEICMVSWPNIYDRIEAIENELDRQIARLGPKPRYVLDRELAVARQAIQEAESEQEAARQKLDAIRRRQWVFAQSDLQPVPDEDDTSLNQAMKHVQTELGLPAGDEKTFKERLDDIKHFLSVCSAERRDEVIEKTTKAMNIQIKGELGLPEEADYFSANKASEKTYGLDETYAIEGELPLARKKYNRVTKFLLEHDRKSTEVAHAMLEKAVAQENLDRKKKPFGNSENTDNEANTIHKNEIAMLDSALNQKSEAVSIAKKALANQEALLGTAEKAMGLKPDPADTNKQRINALRNKLVQLGGHDGTGGKIQQLTQEQVRLEREIENRQADLERMKETLKAAQEAVENDGGPFQFSPGQVNVLAAINTFTQQHSLRQQALDAALGLAESAVNSGKRIPDLATFDFDDEFAPIHLQAVVGDDLTFNQASRIVQLFKNLKASFPPSPAEPLEGQPQNLIEQVQALADRARNEMKTGAQQYDDEIRSMSKRAIHFVEHEPGDLKGFSEYFAAHSASGNKIITLLRERLISKIELENYMKAVRGVDGYQTVDEFEHFLGYRHGVNVPHFKAVVRMLSDKGTEEFMHSAFPPVTVTATDPAAMKESVAGMKEYAVAVIANYVLDDIAFDNGRRTAAFLANVQDTLTPYANAAGLSETELIKAIHSTLMWAHAAAVEQQLDDYWVKPSAFLVQAVTWYFSSYKPLLVTHTAWQAKALSLSNMSFLYLLDLTNRGDYLHRVLTPFQHWLERYGVDLDRTSQYAYHSGIEQISEVGGLAMPLGKAASSVILLKTGSALFARQHNANPHRYRSISRLVPEIVKSMGSGQGVQVPLLNRVTPQKVKTMASATAGLVLAPVATIGAYAHSLISGFTYAQTFGFALASSLTFDFFMNDNKMLNQWLGGPIGRSLDRINRWRGLGETDDEYLKRTAIAPPQGFSETDEAYANRVKANNTIPGWTRQENYLQFRERHDRTMKLFENGWEKYFRENVPKWSFSHAESIPYFYTLGTYYEWRRGDDNKAAVHGHPQ